VVIAFTALFVFCTNQFHKWAHMKTPPPWIRMLQRAHLILSPEHHVVHHTAPRDKYYCITVGWMNPLLDKIQFFRFCEWAITRIHPRALRPDPADRPQKPDDAAMAMPS
jgi:ubiquitin-conjugating enzyme E2 variant